MRRATAREADELTGFTIGGIPPFGHVRATRVIMDPDLGRFQVVWAAAGLPTAVFPVPPGTLRTLANAMVAPITEAPQPVDDGSGPRGSRRVRVGRLPRRRPRDAPERGGVTAPPSGSGSGGPSPARQPRDATIVYPGGLRARWRWGGSGEGPAVFALTEAGGPLTDHGAARRVDLRGRCAGPSSGSTARPVRGRSASRR